jgi:N-acyl homoserine lactone hydrolase
LKLIRVDDVRRIELGTFVRPPQESGTAEGRVETVLGYVARTRGGLLLLDTGLGEADEETETWYRPRRIRVDDALRAIGVAELATARSTEYTGPDLVDFDGARYELLDGESQIAPGVHVIPTPGHVDGHQSVVLECEDGSIVLAGQAHDAASQWSADVLAARAHELGHEPPLPIPSP